MNFDEAIQAHSSWKLKLKNYLASPDGSIDIDKLSKDNQCVLGSWLYSSESKNYQNSPEFKELVAEHKEFHKAAAEIVKRKNNGEDIKEEVAIGSDSVFSRSSSKVVTLLMALKKMNI